MILSYAIIVLVATTIGAIAGLGGGVIIKPLFDLLGYHDAQTIGVLSAFAVFTMSVLSLYKHKESMKSINYKVIVLISMGSFFGGLTGESLFKLIKQTILNEVWLTLIQSILLFSILLIIVCYSFFKEKIRTHKIRSGGLIFLTGLLLGSISVFLGIGGGPLNIIALSFFFSLEMKPSVIYSICTVFFAQFSKLTQVYLRTQFAGYDLKLIIFICCFAGIGGYLGTVFNHKLTGTQIEKVYILTLSFLLIITSINIVGSFIQVYN